MQFQISNGWIEINLFRLAEQGVKFRF